MGLFDSDLAQDARKFLPYVSLPIVVLNLESLYLLAIIAILVHTYQIFTAPIDFLFNYRQKSNQIQRAAREHGVSTGAAVGMALSSVPLALFLYVVLSLYPAAAMGLFDIPMMSIYIMAGVLGLISLAAYGLTVKGTSFMDDIAEQVEQAEE